MHTTSGIIKSAGSNFGRVKRSKVNASAVAIRQLDAPSSSVALDTAITGFSEFSTTVGAILADCGISKVAAPVIESVSVGMVGFKPRWRSSDKSMQKHQVTPRSTSSANVGLGVQSAANAADRPLQGKDVRSVLGTDQRDFTLGERNLDEWGRLSVHYDLLTGTNVAPGACQPPGFSLPILPESTYVSTYIGGMG